MSAAGTPPPSLVEMASAPASMASIQLTPLIPQEESVTKSGEAQPVVSSSESEKAEEKGESGSGILEPMEAQCEVREGDSQSEKVEGNKDETVHEAKERRASFVDAEESSSMSPSRLQINLDEEPFQASSEKIGQSESNSVEMNLFLEPEVVLAEKVNGAPFNIEAAKEDEIEVLQEKPSEIPRLKVKRDLMYTEEEIQQNQADALAESGESLQKKPKLANESLAAILSRPLVNLEKPSDLQHPSLVTANDMIQKLAKDIKTLHFMAKQKEKEWNYILRLKKMKEEMEVKLRRQREIIQFSMQPVEQDLVNLPLPNVSESFVRNHNDQLRHMNGMMPPNPPQMQGIGNLPSVSPPTMSPMNQQSIKLEGYRRDMPLLTQPSQMMQNQQIPVQQKIPPPQYKPQPMVQIPASAALGLANRCNSQSPGPVPPTPPSQTAANSAITALLNSRLQKQRPILPKPQELQNMGNLQWNEELVDPRNRVGPTVNVQRIIDDYRSKHPEDQGLGRPMRRGGKFIPPSYPMQQNLPGLINKRISVNSASASISGGNVEIGAGVTGNHGGEKVSLENFLQQRIKESPSGVNFKDLLLQFAKLSQTGQQNANQQQENIDLSKVAAALSNSDITLQPILPGMKGQKKHPSPDATPPPEPSSSSILHGALSGTIARGEISVKPTGSNYTPTLASLLTTSLEPDQPEVLTLSNLLNTTKGQVTIAKPKPVTVEARCLPGMYGVEPGNSPTNSHSSNGAGPPVSSDSPSKKDDQEVPKCQGCNLKPAQFVCAGCGSQWYCSRECQVDAWEDHSDNCVG